MDRRLVLIFGAGILWGCESKPQPPASQPGPSQGPAVSTQPNQPASRAATPSPAPSAGGAGLYQEDFQNTPVGEVPKEFMVLEGEFAVREQDGNRFLELPGEPLSTFGLLFGPSQPDQISVQARFNGTRRGRQYPSFGVGLGGAAGYQLIVAAGKETLDLLEGEEIKASVEYPWTQETWTAVRLQIRKVGDGRWKIEGKAWPHGSPEPAGWMIILDTTESPPTGRPALWASPYAGTPIQFDDLMVSPAAGGGTP